MLWKKCKSNKYKLKFAQEKEISLGEALVGADVFIGVSKGNLLNAEMLNKMAPNPIVFAMANPTPEISYEEGKKVPGIIMATGRSDYPNQVNNVLGFPFIFRAALDTRAKAINKEMKLAAIKALAGLAHKKVPPEVVKAYGQEFTFGPDYIIPKPFDPRVLYHVAPAVAKAAMDSGVAQISLDLKQYAKDLKKLAKKLSKGKF